MLETKTEPRRPAISVWLAYILLVMTAAFWSGTTIVGRAATGEIPPFSLTFWRWLAAFIVFVPFGIRAFRAQRDIYVRYWGRMVGFSFFGIVGFTISFFFGLQHSGMARPAFKRCVAQVLPQEAERSTFVLMSCVALGVIFVFWQPMGGVLWDVREGLLKTAITVIYLSGWVLMMWSTCLIDHFDLFGLRQAWLAFMGRAYNPPMFRLPGAYRVIRHPVYAGWLVVFWATPAMTFTRFVMAAGMTLYVLIGVYLEERELVRRHPCYRQYRRKVPMLIPSAARHLARSAPDQGDA